MEPSIGVEPTTYWLRINCSTNWAKAAWQLSSKLMFLRNFFDFFGLQTVFVNTCNCIVGILLPQKFLSVNDILTYEHNFRPTPWFIHPILSLLLQKISWFQSGHHVLLFGFNQDFCGRRLGYRTWCHLHPTEFPEAQPSLPQLVYAERGDVSIDLATGRHEGQIPVAPLLSLGIESIRFSSAASLVVFYVYLQPLQPEQMLL